MEGESTDSVAFIDKCGRKEQYQLLSPLDRCLTLRYSQAAVGSGRDTRGRWPGRRGIGRGRAARGRGLSRGRSARSQPEKVCPDSAGEGLPGELLEGLDVAGTGLLDDFGRQRRRRGVRGPVPARFLRQPVADELLVEARLRPSGRIVLGVPGAGGL